MKWGVGIINGFVLGICYYNKRTYDDTEELTIYLFFLVFYFKWE